MKHYDLIVIGGGPIGIACGLEAKKNGLNYLIIEKGPIVNSLFNYPINMQFFSSSEKLEIDGIPFISNEAKPKRNEALEYYRRIVTSNDINIHLFEKVNTVKKENKTFFIDTEKQNYTANQVIVATGFYDIPNTINVPGEDLPKVSHYYKDPHFFAKQKLVVVGASNSAVDAALECYRKGADVTMIVRSPEIGNRVKYWVKPDIENRISEGSINVFFNSTVNEILPQHIIINTPEEKVRIENDYVLALTGYTPNFDFLQKIGIQLSDDEKKHPKYDDQTMESNISGLYLAGVICGGMDTHVWFIENSRIHAKTIIKHIISNQSSVS
ncbi:YpdA family putative bacillithiol disulfide reductase [Aquimarina sp. AD1]|uniref:YpdA family putative bacillithiol disulfide reductase n=1 Tax=Aquimarina sp. (strain AD1) TaxID=1714848 RepID=UPI000E5365D8|nr:YpdA family putative bacillithiol disulfide reductase [Aquimarina sp. AD1]AXT58234.1 YpdA family putative bacillithiol disulfide reductase [Aquimarina sp. AD1]RKN16962.1 YpdA family putative bacillithiol disulfide reductase [Aquimarina sp. AD1]